MEAALKIKIRRISVTKEGLRAFILLFPFLPVTSLDYANIYDLLLIADIFYILLLCFKNRVYIKPEMVLILLFAVWLCFSCVMNGKSMLPGVYYGGKIVAFVFINEYYLQHKSLVLLNVTKFYMSFLIIINTFFQLVAQDFFGVLEYSGNRRNFFAGDNELGYYYIAFISLCIVLDKLRHKKLSCFTLSMTCICLISLIKAWSAKSIIGISLILLYIIFIYGRKIAKLFTHKFIIIVYICTFIGIVFLGIQARFADIIGGWLDKNLVTLTGRTYIWKSVLNNIHASPVYGYGVNNGGRLLINYTLQGNMASSHNVFLEVILQTGFVGLTLFAGYLIISLYYNVKKKTDDKKYTYLMLVFFAFVIMIMYITTPTIYLVFAYLPIILCSNMDNIFYEN